MSIVKLKLIPVISEKTVYLGQENRYAFWVAPSSTKQEVAYAVENLFKVDVIKVNMVSLPGKTKKFRGVTGRRSVRKKAIVTIKKGQKISLFEETKKKQ